jgi:glycosyltransferase involved in cell wall biosynthesis
MLQAVDSVLHQTLKRDSYEIIVVKNYLDYDELLEAKGVRHYYIQNTWLSAKLAKGIEEAKGDIICFLDDDDLFKPTKLESVNKVFEESQISWYKNLYEIVDMRNGVTKGKLNITGFNQFNKRIDKKDLLKQYKDLSIYLNLSVNLSTQCVKADIARKFSDKIIKAERSIDELAFFFSLEYGSSIYVDNDILTLYRIHGNNISYYNLKVDYKRYAIDFYKAYKSYEAVLNYFKDNEVRNLVLASYTRLMLLTKIWDVFLDNKIKYSTIFSNILKNLSVLRYDRSLPKLLTASLIPGSLRKILLRSRF